MLTIGDYCEVFINTYETWLQGMVAEQGLDFLIVICSLDDRLFRKTVRFGVPKQLGSFVSRSMQCSGDALANRLKLLLKSQKGRCRAAGYVFERMNAAHIRHQIKPSHDKRYSPVH